MCSWACVCLSALRRSWALLGAGAAALLGAPLLGVLPGVKPSSSVALLGAGAKGP
ncbi:hypothetical protein AVU99_gp057 [Mycobacterium phage Lolly9]|uniref:Uncharacterized protein n=1 Tax=Mycobacterium phage Lolly9 TaxID=1698711 RepID=A0A0K2FNR2_9CAUD|nr:hypothetical protein AVU99_gp057 [Mycobacterium phage Lolly9]ALA48540.1 hypothetical protein LOLLY9_133 [Mycobacterium phage Lolly9]